MKLQIFSYIILFLLINIDVVIAQRFQVPKDYAFNTKADYKKYEKDIIACANWLEEHPANLMNQEKRRNAINFFGEYVSNSPYIKFEKNVRIDAYFIGNEDLNLYYKIGYVRNILTSEHKTNELENTIAAMTAVIHVYETSNQVKKTSEMNEVLKIYQQGRLKKWIEDKIY